MYRFSKNSMESQIRGTCVSRPHVFHTAKDMIVTNAHFGALKGPKTLRFSRRSTLVSIGGHVVGLGPRLPCLLLDLPCHPILSTQTRISSKAHSALNEFALPYCPTHLHAGATGQRAASTASAWQGTVLSVRVSPCRHASSCTFALSLQPSCCLQCIHVTLCRAAADTF